MGRWSEFPRQAPRTEGDDARDAGSARDGGGGHDASGSRDAGLPHAAIPREESAARAPADPELAAAFPALAHLLGRAGFDMLCDAARQRAQRFDLPAGALLHGLLLRHHVASDIAPSRLAADVAALEWSISQMEALVPRWVSAPRASPADLPGAAADASAAAAPDDGQAEPRNDAWKAAVLEPVRAVDIVPVAFRLASWVRRRHGPQPRHLDALPVRHDQKIVVWVPHVPGAQAAPAGARVWWHALEAGPGRLLERIALGAPLGAAVQAALAHGWIADEAAARALLDRWLREGLFARVLPAR
jgi:hypothetical protein